jgi:uncharacterized protein YecT (DUF1311 family)
MMRLSGSALATLLFLAASAHAQQAGAGEGCARARSAGERAICDMPAVAAADAAMRFAERGLTQELPVADRSALLLERQAWLRARTGSCGAEAGGALMRCLIAETEARTRMLEGGGQNRDPRAPQLRPAFFHEAKPGRYDIDIAYPQIVVAKGAAEAAFNKAAHDLILGDAGLMGEFRGAGSAASTGNSVFYDVPYLGTRLVTVVFWLVSGSGRWEHPFIARESLAFDLQLGRPLVPDDVLNAPPEAARAIAVLCRTRLEAAARAEGWRLSPTADPTVVVANFRNWAPGPLALDILFDPGTVAPEAAGLHACRIDYAALLPFLKLKGPLPPA